MRGNGKNHAVVLIAGVSPRIGRELARYLGHVRRRWCWRAEGWTGLRGYGRQR